MISALIFSFCKNENVLHHRVASYFLLQYANLYCHQQPIRLCISLTAKDLDSIPKIPLLKKKLNIYFSPQGC